MEPICLYSWHWALPLSFWNVKREEEVEEVGEDQAAAVEVGLVPVENQTVEVRVVLGLEVRRRLIPIRSHLIPNNNILTRVVKAGPVSSQVEAALEEVDGSTLATNQEQILVATIKAMERTQTLEVEDGIIATTTIDMVVDPQIATTITEAICTPVEITIVIVLDMAVKIMVIMGEAYSTITTHLEACLEEEGILLHWEPVQDFWVEPWQVSQLCLCTTDIVCTQP